MSGEQNVEVAEPRVENELIDEAALPVMYQRGFVVRIQLMALLVLVLLGCAVIEPSSVVGLAVPFPLVLAFGYPVILLSGWLVYRRHMLLHGLGRRGRP